MTDPTPDAKGERRQQILYAALQAFGEKGYDKTSVNDIVRASGLSKGTLYWYFDSKEAIFVGLVDMVFDNIWQIFNSVVEQTTDLPPPERIRQLLIGMLPMVDEMDSLSGLYTDFFAQAWQTEKVRTVLREAYKRFVDIFAEVIQDGIDKGVFRKVDPQLIARAITGSVDGYWFQQIIGVGSAAETTIAYAEIVIRGLAKGDTDEGHT